MGRNKESYAWRKIDRKELMKILNDKGQAEVFPRIPRATVICRTNNHNRYKYISGIYEYEYNTYVGTYRFRDISCGPWSKWQVKN